MKRKGIVVLLLTALMILGATSVSANTPHVVFNGQPVDVAAVIVDGRTLLPARDIVDLLGGDVDWDGELRQVTINQGSTHVLLTIDSSTALVNGSPVTLDVPAQIINERTKVPLRFVAENLGVGVDFQDGTVIITSTPAIVAQPTPAPTQTIQPAPEVTPEPTPLPEPEPILTPPAQAGLVNINTATLEELQTLPGIGPVIAERIIEARPFISVNQLRNITGIGEVRFNDIRDLVTVE